MTAFEKAIFLLSLLASAVGECETAASTPGSCQRDAAPEPEDGSSMMQARVTMATSDDKATEAHSLLARSGDLAPLRQVAMARALEESVGGKIIAPGRGGTPKPPETQKQYVARLSDMVGCVVTDPNKKDLWIVHADGTRNWIRKFDHCWWVKLGITSRAQVVPDISVYPKRHGNKPAHNGYADRPQYRLSPYQANQACKQPACVGDRKGMLECQQTLIAEKSQKSAWVVNAQGLRQWVRYAYKHKGCISKAFVVFDAGVYRKKNQGYALSESESAAICAQPKCVKKGWTPPTTPAPPPPPTTPAPPPPPPAKKAAGIWVKGTSGKTCNEVCNGVGGTCDSAMQSSLTTDSKVRSAFASAGYTCKSVGGARDYDGAPFSSGRSGDDCFSMKAGGRASSCTANKYPTHAPLCYCKQATGSWLKGANGKTCNEVCNGAGGRVCDSAKQSSLTTSHKVHVAFASAGYTCKGFGGTRDYDGAPFSSGRSPEDCFAMKAGGRASSCTANKYPTHAPLCYCKQAPTSELQYHTASMKPNSTDAKANYEADYEAQLRSKLNVVEACEDADAEILSEVAKSHGYEDGGTCADAKELGWCSEHEAEAFKYCRATCGLCADAPVSR